MEPLAIRTVYVYQYRLPFRGPMPARDFSLVERTGFLLRVEDSAGNVGWGEAAPLPGSSRENEETVRRQCENIAGLPWQWERIDTWPPFLSHISRSVRFAVESAWTSLRAAQAGESLAHRLWGREAQPVRVNAFVTGEGDALVAACAALASAGYGAIKLKVGRRPVAEDIERVRLARGACGAACDLRLDANRAWSLEEAEEFCRGVEALGIEYLEEPLVDPSHLRTLAERTAVRFALDESLSDSYEHMPAPLRAVAAFVLKPTLLGGFVATRRWVDIAVARGIRCVYSSAYESGVGMRVLAALASGPATEGVAAGLDTLRHFERDLVPAALVASDGTIAPDALPIRDVACDSNLCSRLTVSLSLAAALRRQAGRGGWDG